MNQSEPNSGGVEWNRREFIRGTSFGALMALMGGIPLSAQADGAATNAPAEAGFTKYSTESAPVNCAVIGCGLWGREILETLVTMHNAPVVAICDTYEPAFKRVKETAPNAETFTDYQKLLAKKEVEAVIVATPSHLHREIVLAALAAGKHVYCEVPLAITVEDARAIAQAAKTSLKVNFQPGLQARSDSQQRFVQTTAVRAGDAGKIVMARSQWHKKESWRRPSGNPDREKALNWRLSRETSPGLMGEIGIHQLDVISWCLGGRPKAVTGFGGILTYDDGRDVADTVQTVFEFPDGVNFSFDCTLANSFDSSYDMIYGTEAAVMMRDGKAWLFKEPDAALAGWEVYARKDQFYTETGIALVADATKQVAINTKATDTSHTDSALHAALKAFITNSHLVAAGAQQTIDAYGDDADALRNYLTTDPVFLKSRRPAADYRDGFEATVAAIKANEAVIKGQKIVLQKEWFEI